MVLAGVQIVTRTIAVTALIRPPPLQLAFVSRFKGLIIILIKTNSGMLVQQCADHYVHVVLMI